MRSYSARPGPINQGVRQGNRHCQRFIALPGGHSKKAPSTGLDAFGPGPASPLGSAEEVKQNLRPLIGQAQSLDPKLLADPKPFKRRTLPGQIGIYK